MSLYVLFISDPFGRNRPPGRGVHAQESPTPQVPVRAERQGVLQQCQRWFVVSDLLHDAEQTRYGQLVNDGRDKQIQHHQGCYRILMEIRVNALERERER